MSFLMSMTWWSCLFRLVTSFKTCIFLQQFENPTYISFWLNNKLCKMQHHIITFGTIVIWIFVFPWIFQIFFFRILKMSSTMDLPFFVFSYSIIVLELFDHAFPYGESSTRKGARTLCLQVDRVQYHYQNLFLD
jgi:hypothetical protein